MDEYMNGSTRSMRIRTRSPGTALILRRTAHIRIQKMRSRRQENPAGNEDSVQADHSAADEAGTAGAAGTYQNQNTGSFSNDSHWGTYEDWNFGNIEAKKEAEEKKQTYAGQETSG